MRLFIGIDIPERLKNRISQFSAELQTVCPGRYVNSDGYHITLAYIGECDEEMKSKAVNAMQRCASMYSSVMIDISKAAVFGKEESGILHLRCDKHGLLQPITDDLRRLLNEAQLPFDPKPLVSHITLARKADARMLSKRIFALQESFTGTGLTLFHSRRIDDALRYIPIHFERFGAEG